MTSKIKAFGRWLLDNSDPILRLTGTLAIVLGAWIAHSYESKISSITILSNRERSESELRSNMFSNLISPIIGPQKNDEIQPHRERLLVELLALNFHEHFQFKPLMLHVDKRLSEICRGKDEKMIKQAEYDRKSLRSIARRITQKQIKTVSKEGLPAKPEILTIKFPMTKVNIKNQEELVKKLAENKIIFKNMDSYYFYHKKESELRNELEEKGYQDQDIQKVLQIWQNMLIQQDKMIEVKGETEEQNKRLEQLMEKNVVLRRNDSNRVFYFYNESEKELENRLMENKISDKDIKYILDMFRTEIKDKNSTGSSKDLNKMYKINVPEDKDRYLYVGIIKIDPDNETIDVKYSINFDENLSTEQEFTLTWYDFPFTDYSILPNGTRFSIVLNDIKPDLDTLEYIVNLWIIWYPKDYFTPNERPINYKEFRETLGI